MVRSVGDLGQMPFRFQSKWAMGQGWTGSWPLELVDFGRRMYAPGLGRFISRDPAGESAGANLYHYCGNDPINRMDPLGLMPLRLPPHVVWDPVTNQCYLTDPVTGGWLGVYDPSNGTVTPLTELHPDVSFELTSGDPGTIASTPSAAPSQGSSPQSPGGRSGSSRSPWNTPPVYLTGGISENNGTGRSAGGRSEVGGAVGSASVAQSSANGRSWYVTPRSFGGWAFDQMHDFGATVGGLLAETFGAGMNMLGDAFLGDPQAGSYFTQTASDLYASRSQAARAGWYDAGHPVTVVATLGVGVLIPGGEGSAAANTGIAGVTSGEASALARQIYGIEVNGQRAVSSVEAFGSRAGSTFRGRGPLPTSDLDLRITLSDPAHFGTVNAQMTEIGTLFQSTKGFPLQSTYVIPGLPPPTLLQTPFIPLHP